MNTNDHADDNVARLLDQSYNPPTVPAEFADRVRQHLLAIAAERVPTPRRPWRPRRLSWLAAAAALLACIFAGFQMSSPRNPPGGEVATPAVVPPTPLVAGTRPQALPATVIAPGTTMTTTAGQRRRFELPDGSALYLNQNTTVRCEANRKITLAKGEVFVEVAPRPTVNTEAKFVVQTPSRAVTALGTKFIVRADDAGTNVAVTQGKVKVSGLDGVLTAGQQLLAGTTDIAPAPRASFLLEWARDLIAAAEGALVPAAKHSGGALVVVDSSGQEATLSLRKYHLDVHIEDGYARTTIDQTYFNDLTSRQEGTFYFPLPPDASMSRLAMYVDGNLMEGGMVERNEGRQIFESIVRKMKDPALLEWVDGNTFKMRVFPLEARQEKRIVLSYTQKLNGNYGKAAYRFPGGHSLEHVGLWSFQARVIGGASYAWGCDTHTLKAAKDGKDLVLNTEARDVRLERDLVLSLTDPFTSPAALNKPQFASAQHEGKTYFQMRLRPDLPAGTKRQRRDWVFLVETSAERDSLLARTQIEIMRTLLNQAEHDDTFAVVTAGARAVAWSGDHATTPGDHATTAKPLPVTSANIAAAVAFLEQSKLIGALDLERALEAVEPLAKAGKDVYLVHLGSGLTVLGERRPEVLAKRLPAGAHYVGVAVGKRWARTFMQLAAAETGGYVTQINPDEQVGWRALELYSVLNAPRLLDAKVSDPGNGFSFAMHTPTVAQGEELCAIAIGKSDAAALPTKLIVTGRVGGKEYRHEITVKDARPGADYLPRTWGRLEVERLVADGADKNKAALIDLSKRLYVMTPFTSLLVLENEAMYAQYNVDRGRKDHWALYPCPQKIPVVYEPLPGMVPAPAVGAAQTPVAKLNPGDVLKTVVVRAPVDVFTVPQTNAQASDWLPIYNPITGLPMNQSGYGDISYLGYYQPALALVVKGTSRIQSHGYLPLVPSQEIFLSLEPPGNQRLHLLDSNAFLYDRLRQEAFQRELIENDRRVWTERMLKKSYMTASQEEAERSLLRLSGSNAYSGYGRSSVLNSANTFSGIITDPRTQLRFPSTVTEQSAWRDDDQELRKRTFDSLDRRDLLSQLDTIRGRDDRDMRWDSWDRYAALERSRSKDRTVRVIPRDGVDPAVIEQAIRAVRGEPLLRSARDDEPRYEFNMQGKPWKEVLTWLYEKTNLPIVGVGSPSGSFNIRGPVRSRYTISEVVDVINDALAANENEQKYILVRRERNFVLLPADKKEDLYQYAPVLSIADLKKHGRTEHVIIVKPLKRIVAEEVVPEIQKMLSPFGCITSLKPNSLRILDNVANVERILDVIDSIDNVDDCREPPVAYSPLRQWMMAHGSDICSLPLFVCPMLNIDGGFFRDLVSFAPGLRPSENDLRGLLDAESSTTAPPLGKIDGTARKLIDRARSAGWQSVTVPEINLTITCDGAGRYRYERKLSTALQEIVICDGTALFHLYPELGLAGRRTVSRFHRTELSQLVPWALPPVEDLARGADVLAVDDHTVAVTAPERPCVQLVFVDEGRLAERQITDKPAGRILAREVYGADGSVRQMVAGTEKLVGIWKVKAAEQPDLKAPKMPQFVVLPVPARTLAQVMAARKITAIAPYEKLKPADALKLIAAEYASGGGQLEPIIRGRFMNMGFNWPGLRVLLFSATHPLGDQQHLRPSEKTPADKYMWRVESNYNGVPEGPTDTFVGQLSMLQWLVTIWKNGHPAADKNERTLRFVKECSSPAYAWAVTATVLQHAPAVTPATFKKELLDTVAARVKGSPSLEYATRYELARCEANERHKANADLLALYRETLERGMVPPVDASFIEALQDSGNVRKTTAVFAAEGHASWAMLMAEQCLQLGNANVADQIVEAVEASNNRKVEGSPLTPELLVYRVLRQQWGDADRLLSELLADKAHAQSSDLWRLGHVIALNRKQNLRAIERLERALEQEFSQSGGMLNLEEVRRDYGELLGHYTKQADALALLEQKAPPDFAAKIERTADRWRALDPAGMNAAAPMVASLLRKVGDGDAAWDYQTTPLAQATTEWSAWRDIGNHLSNAGEIDQADRAFATACALKPTDPHLLWQRAANLSKKCQGMTPKMRELYQQIAEGKWVQEANGVNYEVLKREAKALLGK